MERSLTGRRISGVVVANTKILRGQDTSTFERRVVGKQFGAVKRRGKYLLLALEGGTDAADPRTTDADPETPPILLCIHLKMRGQLRLQPADDPIGPYHCLSLLLGDDAAVRYYDMWTWGEVRAMTAQELAALPSLAKMGPEPLEPGWDGATLRERLRGRRGPLKPALLEQTVVAGVGNIYADESLFRAGLNPRRAAGSLDEAEAARLAEAIRAILGEAVAGGGTMSEEFTDVAGSPGRFVPKVYDRGGEPCPACGTSLTRIKLGGRGTVFCAGCQPGGPTEADDAPEPEIVVTGRKTRKRSPAGDGQPAL
jgi:formamidopyrimidine-DNA glycosylase